MKLASALTERSDLQRRIAELSARLNQNAKVQEGDAPAEDPAALLKELDDCLLHLETLVTRINLTNSLCITDGQTMTALLARRDRLMQTLRIRRQFLDAASCRVDRYTKTEIRILPTVKVSDLQRETDALAATLRQLNETIQQLNWTTELQ